MMTMPGPLPMQARETIGLGPAAAMQLRGRISGYRALRSDTGAVYAEARFETDLDGIRVAFRAAARGDELQRTRHLLEQGGDVLLCGWLGATPRGDVVFRVHAPGLDLRRRQIYHRVRLTITAVCRSFACLTQPARMTDRVRFGRDNLRSCAKR